jgi:Flp pilus assembly protein TadG
MTALGRFRVCSVGAVAVVTALVLPLLLGFVSLGTEVGHWYLAQREMQGAADAAAISAAAEYIVDFPSNPNSLTYQTVGQSYTSYNGFTIPTSNVCLVSSTTNNCGSVLALDSRSISAGCTASGTVCIVVEVTQDTMTWLTRKASVEPAGRSLNVQSIPGPTLKARAIVSMNVTQQTTTTNGADCILALANDPGAVTVVGGGDLVAKCGVAIDGGIDQNVNGTATGGITFNGSNAKAEVTSLTLAANVALATECPAGHCYLWSATQSPPTGVGSTTALPASAYHPNTATQDPYAAQVAAMFQSGGVGVPPEGVARVTLNQGGSGYTNGTRVFTLGNNGNPTVPAQVVVTVSGGKVTAILGVFDPGVYSNVPASATNGTDTTGGTSHPGTGASFKLAEGCFTFPGTSVGGVAWTPIAGRKYCSIFNHGNATINFPKGNYYIAGGDSNCVGLCQSGNNAVMTSDVAGVTFFLTNGEGTGAFGTSSYATVSIQSGTVNLCSPGTNCGTTCTNSIATSCMLIIQNPAAPLSTTLKSINNIVNGNGKNTLAGLVYVPKQTFSTIGTSSIGGCFGVIAYFVDIGGTPEFSNGCLPGNGIGGTTTTITSLSPPTLFQ